MITNTEHDMNGQDNERPGSRLKQNIDELDTLLSDLNNARKDTLVEDKIIICHLMITVLVKISKDMSVNKCVH